MASKLKLGAYTHHYLSISSLLPSSISAEPCYTWLPWDDLFYYLLHTSKSMRRLSPLSLSLAGLFHLAQCPIGSSVMSWVLGFHSFGDHSCVYVNASCFLHWSSIALQLLPRLSHFDECCNAVVQGWPYCLMNWFQFLRVYLQYWDSWITYYFYF